jgi:hypothetical protein
MTLLERPLFYIGDHYVTILGLIAFAGFFAAGLLIARFLQSQIVRRFFRPRPVPSLFVKNGTKRCRASSSVMPRPLSLMDIKASAPCLCAVIVRLEFAKRLVPARGGQG